MNRLIRLELLLFATVFAAGGCLGSDDKPTSYVELLRFVPDQAEYRSSILIVDYAALRDLPAPDGLSEDASELEQLAARSDWYFDIEAIRPLGVTVTLKVPQILDDWEVALGVSIADVDRSLHVQVVGPNAPSVIAVARGTFDADQVPPLLASCAECVPADRPSHEGVRYYDWGEGINARLRLAPPVYDDIGHGGQFHFTDDYILRTDQNSALTAAIDANQGPGSVADRADFGAIAEALESRGVVVAVLTDRHQGPEWVAEGLAGAADTELLPAVRRALASQPRLRPYSAYALGAGIEDGETFMTLVLAHASTDEATENVTRLRLRLEKTTTAEGEPWGNVFSSWEIESDGELLSATLRGAPRWTLVSLREALLLHE